MQDTFQNLEDIKENQDTTLARLKETLATLLSLQASVVDMETGLTKRVSLDEKQRSITALSNAFDKNFCSKSQKRKKLELQNQRKEV